MCSTTTPSTSSPNNNVNNNHDHDNTIKTVLVTGGCGYIGSHTIVVLLQHGYHVVVVDNLCNSTSISLDRIASIVQFTSIEERNQKLQFHQIDICNLSSLQSIFEQQSHQPFHSIIHFAGLKAVGESTKIPLTYYENNLIGTFNLLHCMEQYHCHNLVFSSSATVYGAADVMPITEETPVGVGITNAYGRTKYMIEEILRDYYHSKSLEAVAASSNSSESNKTTIQNDWSITILRYFNPVGAHPSGLIGEDPNGIPNNLMPYVSQVAVGRRPYLTIFGNDYSTPDGTGVRDYLHVVDLAEGHLSALQYMDRKKQENMTTNGSSSSSSSNVDIGGIYTFNLGTGNGYSVLQMCDAMSLACGHKIPYQIGHRRPGDIATCYANPDKAYIEMNWKATRDLNEMCRDLWCWQSNNPNGYTSSSSEEGTTTSTIKEVDKSSMTEIGASSIAESGTLS